MAPNLMAELVQHEVEVALADSNPPPEDMQELVTHIPVDKASLGFYREECLEFKPDVAIHLSANSGDEVSSFLDVFQGQVSHTVVTSNTNVYLAHGRLRETEPGSSISVPIDENSPLRTRALNGEGADKLVVEKIMRNAKDPSTVLRLPPIYGPEDYHRRFYPMIVRMLDERPFVLLGHDQAAWRWTHSYVGDVAHALFLAATKPGEGHRVYNVGELKTPTMKERLEHLGLVLGWEGRIKVISANELPPYLQTPGDFNQDLLIDTSAIRKDLGYKEPNDYYDGLADSAEWYRENPPAQMAGKSFDYSAEDSVNAMEIRD